MEVVAEVGDADEVLPAVAEHTPDVAICDVQMPPGGTDDGLRAATAIRREHPGTAVVVLSQFVEEHYPLDLIGDDGGPLLSHGQSEAEQRSFDATCRKLFRFLTAPEISRSRNARSSTATTNRSCH